MKNKKGLIIGVIAAIVIIAVAFAVIYFATDLLKTNKQLFYKYISKAQMMNTNFSKMYTELTQKVNANNYSSNGQLDFLATMPNIQTGNMDTQTIFSIKSNGLENKLLKQSYKDFTLSTNNQNILTLKYIRDDNTYALGADNILAKYVAIENANLKDLFTKLGAEDVSTIPDSISTNNLEELLKIDDQTFETLCKTYYSVLYNNINEANYFKTKNADGTETIGISLSEQEVAQLMKTVLETAKNDNVLLNLIVSKAQLLGYQDVTIQTIQDYLQNLLDKMTETTYTPSHLDFIRLSLIKKDRKVSSIQFETKTEEQAANADNSTEIEEVNSTDVQPPVSQTSNYSSIKIDVSEANKMVLSIATQENDPEPLIITMNYAYGENGIEFNMQFEENSAEGVTTPIQLQYKLSGDQSDIVTQNFTLNIVDQNESQTTYQIHFTNNITLKQDVQIEKLTTENSAKLNDMTAEEIQQFMTALVNRIIVLYGSNIIPLASSLNF